MSKCIYGWCSHNREDHCTRDTPCDLVASTYTSENESNTLVSPTYTYRLSRDDYKRIKHFSKSELESFLANFYIEAYNSGVTTLSEGVFSKVDNSIKRVKGIGEKRINEFYIYLQEEMTR